MGDDDAELLALEREFDTAYTTWLDAAANAPVSNVSTGVSNAMDIALYDVVERLVAMRPTTMLGLRVKLKVGAAFAKGGSTEDELMAILQCSDEEARLYIQEARRREQG
jgi:hypothetical protein